ncbi:MAG TPA: hypothetical protein VLG76_05295 [Rhabdochlamydiaceae bacterium]|nr:hypothetical protein [Rhabdochlamydiaceae bacterium]
MDIKNLKYFIFLLVTAAIVYGVLLCRPFSGYCYVFPVTYNKYACPLITTQLEGNPYTLSVSVGSRFPIFLRQKVLDGIDKQFQGMDLYRSIDGSQEEVPYYLVPKLKVGDLVLKNVFAYHSDKDDHDGLGKFLGGDFNLLLDFPHDRIVACDRLSKLQTKGVADHNWIQLPFEMDRVGVVLNVDTDFGTCKLVLNTGCTVSVLKSSVFPANTSFSYVSSSFILDGHQFPNISFKSFEFPKDLNEIDGFIGMDFLKEYTIYLDYAHKVAYIQPPKKYFEHIPVTLSSQNTPIIDVSIEDNVYPLKLDLGFFSFDLSEEVLQNICKTKYSTFKWHDFRGKEYESPAYTIPQIKIGNLTFARVLVNQDSEEFHANATLAGPPLQLPGMIGRPILEKYNLLLDFPHAAIYACNDHVTLQNAGLLSKNLLAVPFTVLPEGIIFSVETDMGTYRLALDTGSTFTVIRAPHCDSTQKFCIMGHDFGECTIKALDVSPQFDFDGMLGMDFLCEYPLFIDYSNKIVFIDLERHK